MIYLEGEPQARLMKTMEIFLEIFSAEHLESHLEEKEQAQKMNLIGLAETTHHILIRQQN